MFYMLLRLIYGGLFCIQTRRNKGLATAFTKVYHILCFQITRLPARNMERQAAVRGKERGAGCTNRPPSSALVRSWLNHQVVTDDAELV
jgi:hypothetical protein